jgi:hypothetical protein
MNQINIVYAPGTGGNHLANLISLGDRYSLSVDMSVYDSDVKNAHQLIPRQNKNVQINTYHMGRFVYQCTNQPVDLNSINILIQLPPFDKKDLAYQRMTYYWPVFKNQFVFFESTRIYSTFLLSCLSKKNWCTINASCLFSEDLKSITSILNQFDISINLDDAMVVHKKWLDKIQKYVTEKGNLTLDH